ncbi:hypothetical protein [Hyphobacterium sp.]|uniref:hypothetical protein n=1 Tax=Hyphobacterium sp. TaxID=2004662 RepID=UPI003B52066D
MILARLSQAVREQNWFAVILEFVIVIAGVVIGFAISGWADDRAAVARADQATIDLLEEMEINVWLLRSSNAETARLNASREIAARSTAEAALRRDPELQPRAIEGVMSLAVNPPMPVSRAVYDELVATGTLRLIDETRARRAASRFFSEVDYARDQLAQLNNPQVYDALGRHVGLFWSEDAVDALGSEVDLDALAADPEAVTELMIARTIHLYFQRVRDALLDSAETACTALAEAADRSCAPLVETSE